MRIVSTLTSQRTFLGVSALLFAACVTLTILWCTSMSAMNETPMPGDWTMAMTWMRRPGQTWFAAAASFLGMWNVMMVAMMLPSLVPLLWRYRRAIGNQHVSRLGRLTMLVGLGYYIVWTVLGLVSYLIGVTLAAIELQSPAIASVIPLVAGMAVLFAGILQFSKWKAHHLACCKQIPERNRTIQADAVNALRHGLHLGVHCGCCCLGLMVILLVIGVMDLRAMVIITVAMTVERLTPDGERIARAIGVIAVGAGLILIVRAVSLG